MNLISSFFMSKGSLLASNVWHTTTASLVYRNIIIDSQHVRDAIFPQINGYPSDFPCKLTAATRLLSDIDKHSE